jgi:hypothetical protein
MMRRLHTMMCLTPAALGLALAVGSAPTALASVQTLTVVERQLAPPPPNALSTEAWNSGRVSAIATRMPDGRIRARLNAQIVLARTITAQLAIQPCDASYNAVDLAENAADPLGHPLLPLPFLTGAGAFKYVKLHRGLNANLRLSAVVSSDDRWTVVPHRWTDCVSVNLIDQRETDKAAIRDNPYIPDREGDVAFAIKPLILSVTQPDDLGRHL